jgi:toxin ParE1/3/4
VTRNFTFTVEAEEDALSIWTHLADEASEAVADRVLAQVYDECEKLGDMPGIGHFREELLDRRFKFSSAYSYLIVYRWEVKPIEIIALVHGARDLNGLLRRRSR